MKTIQVVLSEKKVFAQCYNQRVKANKQKAKRQNPPILCCKNNYLVLTHFRLRIRSNFLAFILRCIYIYACTQKGAQMSDVVFVRTIFKQKSIPHTCRVWIECARNSAVEHKMKSSNSVAGDKDPDASNVLTVNLRTGNS